MSTQKEHSRAIAIVFAAGLALLAVALTWGLPR